MRFAFLSVTLPILIAAAPLSALPREKDRWIRLETPNFTIFSQSGPGRAETLARNLEQLRAVLGQLTRSEMSSPVPTYVYVFGGDKKFTPYKPLYQGRPADLAGYFLDPDHGNFIAVNGQPPPGNDPSDIVYHEFVHYVLANNFPGLPLWLNEGLAELYSTFELQGGRAKLGHPILAHVAWLRKNRRLPLEQLFAVDQDSPEYNERDRQGVFYAQSWALVHYLLIGGRERHGQAGRYLELVTGGAGHAEAFSRAFETDPAKLGKELDAYLGQSEMPFYWTDVEPLPETRFSHHEMKRPDLLARLGDLLSILEGRQDDAGRHFDAALKLEPRHARALAGLGRLELIQGRHAAAAEHLKRSLEAGGGDFLVQYHYADSLLQSDKASADSRQEARAALRRSLQLNPDYAPSWALMAFAFSFEDEPGDEAVRAAETAHQKLPSRDDVANNLMVIYARRGDRAAARRLFDRYFAVQASAAARAQARSALVAVEINHAQKLLDEGRPGEAVALLEGLLASAMDADDRAVVEGHLRELQALNAENRIIERYNEAIRLLNAGDEAAALAILEPLVNEARGAQAGPVRELLRQTRERVGRKARQAQLERVNELLSQGHDAEALELLRSTEMPAGTWEARWVEERIAELSEVLEHNRVVERFNDAVRRFNGGDFEAAVRILEALLPGLSKDSPQYAEVRKLLADAKAELRLRDG